MGSKKWIKPTRQYKAYLYVCPHCHKRVYCCTTKENNWLIDYKYCPYCRGKCEGVEQVTFIEKR